MAHLVTYHTKMALSRRSDDPCEGAVQFLVSCVTAPGQMKYAYFAPLIKCTVK